MTLEEKNKILTRLGHYHLAHSYELMAYIHMRDWNNIAEMEKRLDQMGKEYDAFVKDGIVPQWILDNPM